MEPNKTRTRRVGIHHATNYVYDRPISRSVHYIHLSPRSTAMQTLRSFRLSIQPSVAWTQFEDICGNATGQFEVTGPFDGMSIVAQSTVDVLDADPFAFDAPAVRPMFPISWTLAEHQRLSLPAASHVLVAWGPSYRDAAPVWGSLYSSSQAKEAMTVDVRVTDLGVGPGVA